ncbi:sensor histidine kinase [Pseudofulvibacter geojedonensis]|uniref:histidine kinase n=1 Tax=Pseudofulvibacter geojedonensis TaxID=1123758 RepID=A0ABW3I4C3_9FLAO
MLKNLSLRLRIFLSMIFLVLLASVLMVITAVYQYHGEAQEYHDERLLRKEHTVKDQIGYELKNRTNYPIITKNIPKIFKWHNFIYELADVHNLEIKLYNFEGDFLIASSASSLGEGTDLSPERLPQHILDELKKSVDKRFVDKTIEGDKTIQSSYSYITDPQFKPLAILSLPYVQDDEIITSDLNEYLKWLSLVYLFVLIIAIALAYFLSKYITRSLKTISERINQTRLDKRNTKIEIENVSEEINTLVQSYNSMIDELEESAVKLATSEREQAWREMAKQVAHEIKNPLTPMRLSVQSFQRKFDPNDPDVYTKVDEYSKTLIQQIDTMSSIASAFSNFAKMPAQKNETLNVVEIVRLALDIFNDDHIVFNAEREEIITTFDRTQLIRVITNLVKNAIQAKSSERIPNIVVSVKDDKSNVIINVSDNGVGIKESNKYKIFEPKFTTKTSGMGLGLAMVKNIIETYKGNITFTSQENKGTIFTVTLPKT